jgi:hypothetical protein
MGFLSRIGKSIKKVFSKIGKGIKKIVKKVGRAIGKLGVVGQIGMMFLMPYAMQGIGSLFGNFAGGTAGTWASKLIGSANIGAKALGHTMNAIHTVGTTILKPFTFIRDQIGKSIDWIGTETGTSSLTDGVNKLIGYDSKKVSADVGITEISDSSLMGSGGSATETLGGEYIKSDAFTPEGMESVGKIDFDVSPNPRAIADTAQQNLLDPDASWRDPTGNAESQYIKSDAFTPEGYTSKVPSFTNTSEQQGWFSKQSESIVNSFKNFSAGDVLTAGLRRGGSERLAYEIAGDPPPQRILQTIRREADLLGLSNQFSDSTIYRGVNLASERQGNVWAGSNLLNYDYVKSVGNDGTADYFNNMRGLELRAYNT